MIIEPIYSYDICHKSPFDFKRILTPLFSYTRNSVVQSWLRENEYKQIAPWRPIWRKRDYWTSQINSKERRRFDKDLDNIRKGKPYVVS